MPDPPPDRSPVSAWVAARTHPHTYPGEHPPRAFVVVDDEVVLLDDDLAVNGVPVDQVLADRGLPSLALRTPVLAYGSNRNPATLALKLRHHGYRTPGRGVVVPVLPAVVPGIDVVAGGLSSVGYVFADLYAGAATRDTEVRLHILLLDDDQLRAIHDSERVGVGNYDVALLDGVAVPAVAHPVTVMAYVGRVPVFRSPALGSPLALATVPASGRTLPESGAVAALAHPVEALGLAAEVRAVIGGEGDGDDLAWDLGRYLNGQWWVRHHTGHPRLAACEELERRLVSAIRAHPAADGGRDLAGRATPVSAEGAYRPLPGLRSI